jgi:hypothetical protein
MVLKLALKPDEAIAIAERKLGALARRDGFLTPLLRGASPNGISVSGWHRVFFLGLDGLEDRANPIEAAPELGWRVFVRGENEIVAKIESRRTENGDYRSGPITEGPFVEGTKRAFREAESLVGNEAVTYEPILLTAPALHVTGLWLKSTQRAADIVLPVAPIDKPFTLRKTFSVADFETLLQQIAKKHCETKRKLP